MDDLERLLEEIVEREASPGTLHLILSKLKDLGRTEMVIQQCRKSLAVHPDHEGLRTLLAETYLQVGLTARASEELERVIQGLDESARVYHLLADAYARQGRDREAAGCLDVYLAHRPDDSEALEYRDRLRPLIEEPLSEPSKPVLTEGLEEEVFESPQSDDTLPEIATPTLAELYYRQGQIDAAIETYEKILARSPDDQRANARLEELKSLVTTPQEDLFSSAEAPEETPPKEPALEVEVPESPSEASSEKTSPDWEQRKTLRMIAVLEQWLTRIHDTGIRPST